MTDELRREFCDWVSAKNSYGGGIILKMINEQSSKWIYKFDPIALK